MEYGEVIDDIIYPDNRNQPGGMFGSDLFMKHPGFQPIPCIDQFFSKQTVNTISRKLTELLQGVDPHNRPILIPDNTITNVMDAIYASYRPRTGDIYGRYNVPSGDTTDSYIADMIDQVIEVIYSDVKVNLETIAQNEKLSIWTTVLGDFNDHQIRSYAPIKTRVRRPNPMSFFMRY